MLIHQFFFLSPTQLIIHCLSLWWIISIGIQICYYLFHCKKKNKVKKKKAFALTLPTPFLFSPLQQIAWLPLVPFMCCVSNPLGQAFALTPLLRLLSTESSVISKFLNPMVNPTCLSAQHLTRLITGFSSTQFLYVVSRMPCSPFSFSLTGPSFPASLKTQSWRVPSSALGLVSSTSPRTPFVISFIPMTSASFMCWWLPNADLQWETLSQILGSYSQLPPPYLPEEV